MKIIFIHEGYTCCIRDNGIGYLCGYVLLPIGHRYYHQDHESHWDVHGGITYVESTLIEVRNPYRGKWIGFDCAHFGDGQDPKYIREHPERNISSPISRGHTYKDETYVRGQIEELIKQLGPVTAIQEDIILDLPL